MSKGAHKEQGANVSLAMKVVNVLFAIALVIGLSPSFQAFGQPEDASDATGQVTEQAVPDQDGAGDAEESGDAEGDEDEGDAKDVKSSTASDQDDSKVKPSGSEKGKTSGSSKSESVAAQSLTSEGSTPAFNGDADPKLVTRGLSVTLYKDASHEHELGDDEVASDATLYGKIGIDFASDEMPTLEHPNIKYVFPDNVEVKDIPKSALYDAQNNRAGTWYVKNGIAYLNYSETWLKAHTSEVAAHISFEFTMSGEDSGDGSHVAINFPGAASTVKVNTKDGSVSGKKFGSDANKEWEAPSFDESDNTYTWTIKVSPSSYATDLKIIDEIGSNLSFVKDSFKLVDKNGNGVSGTCNVAFDGQKATISLGDLTKGDYYVQYKTKVSDEALAALGNGQELSGVNNKAQWVWGSNGQNKGDSGSKEPQKAKYSLVSKSHSSSSAPEDIEWICDLNTGSLKADLSGYVFTDTLADGHSFKPGTDYQVVDAAGNVIASGNVPADGKTLSISLPQNVGKKQLKVTFTR